MYTRNATCNCRSFLQNKDCFAVKRTIPPCLRRQNLCLLPPPPPQKKKKIRLSSCGSCSKPQMLQTSELCCLHPQFQSAEIALAAKQEKGAVLTFLDTTCSLILCILRGFTSAESAYFQKLFFCRGRGESSLWGTRVAVQLEPLQSHFTCCASRAPARLQTEIILSFLWRLTQSGFAPSSFLGFHAV